MILAILHPVADTYSNIDNDQHLLNSYWIYIRRCGAKSDNWQLAM